MICKYYELEKDNKINKEIIIGIIGIGIIIDIIMIEIIIIDIIMIEIIIIDIIMIIDNKRYKAMWILWIMVIW